MSSASRVPAGAVVLDRLAERGGRAVVVGHGEGVGQQHGGALLGGGVVDEQRRGGAAACRCCAGGPRSRRASGRRAAVAVARCPAPETPGQLARVPEVADAAGERPGPATTTSATTRLRPRRLGLLAALGAALGELQPVDDVLGVLVGLLDEGELLGAVVGLPRRPRRLPASRAGCSTAGRCGTAPGPSARWLLAGGGRLLWVYG